MSEVQTTVVEGVQSVTMAAQPTGPVAPPEQTPNPERPDWLPQEFSTVEQFVDAYKTLKGGDTPPSSDEPAPTQESDSTDEVPTDYAVEIVRDAGLDWDEVSGHFMANGALNDEHYSKLEEAGFPRQLVDSYLAGQQALLAQFKATVLTAAGGEDAWKAAADWAAAGNLTEAELAAYNRSVESGDVEAAKLAVQGLIARHAKAQGSEPNLADGQGGTAHTPGYASRAQMIADMQNPLYEKDPAFRAEVARKVQASPSLF